MPAVDTYKMIRKVTMEQLLKLRLFIPALLITTFACAETDVSSHEKLAEWGDVALTVADMEVFFSSYSALKKSRLLMQSKFTSELMQDLLLQKLATSQADIDALLADETVRKQIEKQKRKILFEEYRDRFVQNNLLDDYSDIALENYTINKDSYVEPEKRVVSHVLISTEKRTDAEAAAMAASIKKQLKNDKIDFATAIERYSDDSSKHNNSGRIDVSPGKTVKPFELASFQLTQPGEISEPVKTSYGYHLIRLDEIIPGRQKTFAEVQQRLEQEAKVEHQETLWEQHLMQLKQAAGAPEVNQDMVKRYLQDELSNLEKMDLLTN